MKFSLKFRNVNNQRRIKILKQSSKGLNKQQSSLVNVFYKCLCSGIFQILNLMPKKYNRSRNTVTVPANGEFIKSDLSGFARESSFLSQNFSSTQKAVLNLKLLQKCQEKIFKIKQGQYQKAMQNQQETNEILASIQAETIRQVSIQNLKGSARLMELNRQARMRNSDCLISSWTAFVNLDITFKTKKTQLLKQNKVLRNKIVQMEAKIKALYPTKTTGQQKENKYQQQNKQKNIQKIEARINQHKLLTKRLKQKIQQTQTEKLQLQKLFETLVEKCQQKFSHEVVERLVRIFQKD